MPEKNTPSEFEVTLEKIQARTPRISEKDHEAWKREMERLTGRGKVKGAADDVKDHIRKQGPEPPEQQIFSFLPTKMTRISPFFPLSRKEMKNRPIDKMTWETSWGRFSVTGERLAIHDESVLLAVLLLMRKYQAETFQTTRHEICKVMGVTPQPNTYNAIWASLDRLTGTKINIEAWDNKAKSRGKKRKARMLLTGTILSGAKMDAETGKLLISINPYFLETYAQGLLTNLNLQFRAELTGDITKALYRFYMGQRGDTYQCHLLTLAKAINLNIEAETFRLRSRIRTGLRELRKKGYIKRWRVSKTDIVSVWKTTDQLVSGGG